MLITALYNLIEFPLTEELRKYENIFFFLDFAVRSGFELCVGKEPHG